MDCRVAALLAVTGVARLQAVAKCRHCERSEAIHVFIDCRVASRLAVTDA